MASLKVINLVVLVCILMASTSVTLSNAATSCNQLGAKLKSCDSYLMGHGDPSEACCDSFKTVYKSTTTKEDRQFICTCLKEASGSANDDQKYYALNLPSKCGVNLKIDANADCKSIN
ncbi:hypothetical protein ACFE04_000794 [Oxalis oulophora]